MIQLKHVGIYVSDLPKVADFYKNVFFMTPICEEIIQTDQLIDDILGCSNAEIKITKLITEQGRQTGNGDMLELITVLTPADKDTVSSEQALFACGMKHICLGVDDLSATVDLVCQHGGKLITKIHHMENGRKCCFVTDNEGNYLEIIERQQ